METKTEKQIRSIKFKNSGGVEIRFAKITSSQDEEDGSELPKPYKYSGESENRPHKDFVSAMTKLRKFGLEIAGIEVDSKKIGQWGVVGIKIDGDYLLRQSRVIITMSKEVELTGKLIKFPISQITMYPDNEDAGKYHNADKMTKVIEEVIDEAWSYLGGKYSPEAGKQLPLFAAIQDLKVA